MRNQALRQIGRLLDLILEFLVETEIGTQDVTVRSKLRIIMRHIREAKTQLVNLMENI